MGDDSRALAVMPGELATKARQLDPYPWFREMRAQGAVRYDDARGTYDAFHYDEVVELSVEYERFGKEGTSFLDGAWMSRDPPIHTDLRSMAENYFRPSYVQEHYGPAVERHVERLVDEAVARDGPFDFVEAVAKPLPILVIAEMLGVPSEKLDTFREWSTALIGAPTEPTEAAKQDVQERMLAAIDSLNDFFRDAIERREDEPKDDLITKFVQAESAYEHIERENTVACCGMLLVAGNVTTTAYMTSALWTFIEEGTIPELQGETVDLGDALEEVLRYRTPVMPQKRIAREDTELGGVEVPEGSLVTGWLSSANRDEAVFENPDEFDPTRSYDETPIPFGKGIHYCLGAPLANLEAQTLFTELLDRIDGATLATDEITPYFSPEIYGAAELPVTLRT
ncbi:cytochrome P450 [Halorarius litoreus]|uniref:cytochrome P450 n=1 Tax=Halorarius litoreus TaxID=2962676 RepID=UPI0020CC6A9C|nr:cytochrome P450 [Halorarius litoreus]